MSLAAVPTTRLAPSPTGALHLGNARTFLVNWALARQAGWRVVLRIDDLDSPRVKPGADSQAIKMLRWLGLDWDGPVAYETSNFVHYAAAWQKLAAGGWLYPCGCTRSQIAAAAMSAPHLDEHELRYPGTCRPTAQAPVANSNAAAGAAWRIRVPDRLFLFEDQIAGRQEWNIQQLVGDFLVTNKQGAAAYQLAVVVDDWLQGVTDVVRGSDLLGSTPRQLWLHELLELPPPRYWHVPLLVGPDGQRLAKRHGGFRLEEYREQGVPVERIIGLIAWWCGRRELEPLRLEEFVAGFSLSQLPSNPIVFQPELHTWLLTGVMPTG